MSKKIQPVTDQQFAVILPKHTDRLSEPVKFTADGCSVNVCTGTVHLGLIGGPLYRGRSMTWIDGVLTALTKNNPGVPIRATLVTSKTRLANQHRYSTYIKGV